jgi:hypothetical protein
MLTKTFNDLLSTVDTTVLCLIIRYYVTFIGAAATHCAQRSPPQACQMINLVGICMLSLPLCPMGWHNLTFAARTNTPELEAGCNFKSTPQPAYRAVISLIGNLMAYNGLRTLKCKESY